MAKARAKARLTREQREEYEQAFGFATLRYRDRCDMAVRVMKDAQREFLVECREAKKQLLANIANAD